MGDADDFGTILTGGVVAGQVDRLGGGPGGSSADVHARGACQNCGTDLRGEFCHVCGQNGHVHRTLTSIGHDILHGVFHFEGKLWATLPMLVRHPGELTRRYIHGQRVRFVTPMALFLFSVFLLFAAVNRVSMPDVASVGQGMAKAQVGLGKAAAKTRDKLAALRKQRADLIAANPKADTKAIDGEIAEAAKAAATIGNLAGQVPKVGPDSDGDPDDADADGIGNVADVMRTATSLPTDIHTGVPTLDAQIDHVRGNPELYAYKLKMASYKYSWALIPISVPFIWLLFFWRRDVGLFDHAIFAIYSLSFMTLLVVGLIGLYLIGVQQVWLWLALLIAPPIHMYRQLKGAYLLGRLGALWRTAALLLMTSIAGSLFFALLLWLEAE